MNDKDTIAALCVALEVALPAVQQLALEERRANRATAGMVTRTRWTTALNEVTTALRAGQEVIESRVVRAPEK